MAKTIFSILFLQKKLAFFKKSLLLFFLILLFAPTNTFSTVPQYLEVPDRGIIHCLQSMRAHQIQMTNFMNYTLNMDTPGFIEIGSYNLRKDTGEIMPAPFYRWRNGPAVQTDRELDLYCDSKGHGFFVYKLPGDRWAFSRDGRLELDSQNRLVSLAHEFPVVSESGGEIFLPEGTITLTTSGVIFVDGEPVDKIKIAIFSDEARNNLVTLDGAFMVYNGGAPQLIEGEEHYSIRQFYMEQNSVLKSLVGDVALSKYPYEASAKMSRSLTKTMSTVVQMANP
jgi:flagellar basal body rod protein FlgG